jgi:hypothetical protein
MRKMDMPIRGKLKRSTERKTGMTIRGIITKSMAPKKAIARREKAILRNLAKKSVSMESFRSNAIVAVES